MIGPGYLYKPLCLKAAVEFTFIRDRAIGLPLPLTDMDLMPDGTMPQSHTQVVGLVVENHP
jgi:hypothetical protein